MFEHKLHKFVGKLINSKFKKDVILDTTCGGKHRLPLFFSNTLNKSRETEFCNLDILILKDNQIKVIIEIEEANIKPTQICGKVLSSALVSYYEHNNEKREMGKNILFIQILDNSKLAKNSSKENQENNLEIAIKEILPFNKIKKYNLFYGNLKKFPSKKLINCIIEHLR